MAARGHDRVLYLHFLYVDYYAVSLVCYIVIESLYVLAIIYVEYRSCGPADCIDRKIHTALQPVRVAEVYRSGAAVMGTLSRVRRMSRLLASAVRAPCRVVHCHCCSCLIATASKRSDFDHGLSSACVRQVSVAPHHARGWLRIITACYGAPHQIQASHAP